MAQQSLYRRYRPQRFGELRGQEHIVRALRNAITGDTTGHAYLFSGPRGTGKTTTARILAKALNCTDLRDGEPCCECESCRAMESGNSYDLFELDAASNNGVDAMRDLIGRAAVGSPGRTKVYILDEVHMLSAPASNALLKTLEEPPDHVTFVLATTDPQKVLPTIRSRTQHYEFSLLSAAQLEEYVRWIIADAGLEVDDDAIAHVVRAGRGSARDTLSALDMVVAAGGVAAGGEFLADLLTAVSGRDTAGALVAIATAVDAGRDPRVVGESLLGVLRDAFLVAVGAPAGHLSSTDRDQAAATAEAVGAAGLTRALELVGAALIEMRQAADPRIPLEVALVRITDASTDVTLAGLAERVGRLERDVARGVVAAASAGERPPAGPPASATPAPPRGAATTEAAAEMSESGPPEIPPPPSRRRPPSPPSPSRRPAQSTDQRSTAPASAGPPPPRSAPAAPPTDAPPPAAGSAAPPTNAPPPAAGGAAGGSWTVEQMEAVLRDGVLPTLKAVARAVYAGGRFLGVDGTVATFALTAPMLDRATKAQREVEAALSAELGTSVSLRLVVDDTSPPASKGSPSRASSSAPREQPDAGRSEPPPEEHEPVDLSELTDATDVAASGVEKLTQAFPGAVIVEDTP